jgi:hypothetical protein
MELWQAAFQLSGFDLALVFDDYAQRAKQWQREFSDTIASLPRPRGSLVRTDEQVGVEVRLNDPLPAGWKSVVRVPPEDRQPLARLQFADRARQHCLAVVQSHR